MKKLNSHFFLLIIIIFITVNFLSVAPGIPINQLFIFLLYEKLIGLTRSNCHIILSYCHELYCDHWEGVYGTIFFINVWHHEDKWALRPRVSLGLFFFHLLFFDYVIPVMVDVVGRNCSDSNNNSSRPNSVAIIAAWASSVLPTKSTTAAVTSSRKNPKLNETRGHKAYPSDAKQE